MVGSGTPIGDCQGSCSYRFFIGAVGGLQCLSIDVERVYMKSDQTLFYIRVRKTLHFEAHSTPENENLLLQRLAAFLMNH